jgi:hypothetical protein
MGGGGWSSETYTTFSNTIKSAPRASVFKSRGIKDDFDPKNIKRRQSLITDEHPNPTPIVVAFDVTGSMGHIPEAFVKELLGDLMNTLNESKAVSDPQVCICAVGDSYSDRAPLQISHFESDNRIVDHLSDIYIEGGGGGTMHESYELAWYWFAQPENLELDCIKQGRKGIFFTIGDEKPYANVLAEHVRKFTSMECKDNISFKSIVSKIEEQFDAFHIVIEQGANFRGDTASEWEKYIGERVIRVSDYKTVCDVIKGVCLMLGGGSIDDAVKAAKDKKGTETALSRLKDITTIATIGNGSGALAKAYGTTKML